jgi:hypothetical protein
MMTLCRSDDDAQEKDDRWEREGRPVLPLPDLCCALCFERLCDGPADDFVEDVSSSAPEPERYAESCDLRQYVPVPAPGGVVLERLEQPDLLEAFAAP